MTATQTDRDRGDEVRRHLGGRRRALKRAARRIVAAREQGQRVVAVLSARGKTTDACSTMAREVSDRPDPARDGHAALDRRARVRARSRDGDQRPRPRGDLADRLAGGHRHRHLAHQGADHRGARRPHPRRARGGQDRARRRLPGRLDRQPRRHHARAAAAPTPPRWRWPRRSAPRSARSTPTSPACSAPTRGSCPRRAQAARRLLRGDARDGGLRRQGAAAALGRVRAQPRRADPLSTARRTRPRYPRCLGAGDHGTTARNRSHPLDRRGAGHAHRRARRARRRRPHLRRARRRQHQRRHDHPERAGLRRRRRRPLVHGRGRRPRRRGRGDPGPGLRDRRSRPTRRWGRSRSSARE